MTHDGITLLRRAFDAASAAVAPARVLVVVGAFADAMKSEVAAWGEHTLWVIENEAWERGIGTSIRVGIAAQRARYPAAAGFGIMVCDQPNVGAAQLRALARRFGESPDCICAASYGGTCGVPAIFPRRCAESLMHMPDEAGAKRLIEAEGARVIQVAMEAATMDVDTPADVARLRGG